MKTADLFQNEADYANLNAENAVSHLRQALRFRTTSHMDTALTDYAQFDAFHAFLRAAYPKITENAVCEEIGHSLLICLTAGWTGLDAPPGSFSALAAQTHS